VAHGEARLFIRRPAREIADFVLDLHRYRTVDAKLGRIYWTRREGNEVTFRFRPRLLGLPGPPTIQRVVLAEDGSGIQIGGQPSWTDRVAAFSAYFSFEEADGGTWVTRHVEFTFARPLAALLDPLFTKWLARDVTGELSAAKRVLESS